MTELRRRRLILLLPCLLGLLGLTPDSLQISVDTIHLTHQHEAARRIGMPWMADSNYVNVRIDTRGLRGNAWRLWIQPRGLSGGNPAVPPQCISWEARTPFVNGTLQPQQRVLIGQGPIDGRVAQDNIIFFSRGQVNAAGVYNLPLEFILEVIP